MDEKKEDDKKIEEQNNNTWYLVCKDYTSDTKAEDVVKTKVQASAGKDLVEIIICEFNDPEDEEMLVDVLDDFRNGHVWGRVILETKTTAIISTQTYVCVIAQSPEKAEKLFLDFVSVS